MNILERTIRKYLTLGRLQTICLCLLPLFFVQLIWHNIVIECLAGFGVGIAIAHMILVKYCPHLLVYMKVKEMKK